MANQLKTVLFLGILTGLFLAIGHLVAGKQGMIIAFVVAMVMNFFSYFFSDKMALAMYGAREISYEEAPWLHQMVEDLARRAGIPKPKIYLAPIHVPNAFATGRDPEHAAVAVTSGILQILNKDELRGVLAHELGHIKNRDILISSIAATIGGAISMLANMAFLFGGRDEENNGNLITNIIGALILFIVAPLAATLIQMAISRSREFLADEAGAKISECPLCLANALRKLEEMAQNPNLQEVASQEVNPGTAHMMIINPLRADTIMKLFSTHPPTEERIRRLEELARKMNYGYNFA